MYWWQSYEQVRQEIKETCEAIRRYGEELRAKGPEACRQFLESRDKSVTRPFSYLLQQAYTLPYIPTI